MAVRFTQFLMPDGRQKQVEIDGLDPLVEAKATWLIQAGYKFGIEMLAMPRAGDIAEFAKEIAGVEEPSQMPNISMEIMNPPGHEEETLCGRLAVNGPDVALKVTEMINEGHALVFPAPQDG